MSNDLDQIHLQVRALRDMASGLLAQAEELDSLVASMKRAAAPKLPVAEVTPGPTESYWQRGYGEGFAGMRPTPPNSNGMNDVQNRGYSNGYRAGAEKRRSTGA